jgi:hypothetical protein
VAGFGSALGKTLNRNRSFPISNTQSDFKLALDMGPNGESSPTFVPFLPKLMTKKV